MSLIMATDVRNGGEVMIDTKLVDNLFPGIIIPVMNREGDVNHIECVRVLWHNRAGVNRENFVSNLDAELIRVGRKG